MPTGNTTTDALQDSLPTVISEARIIREFEGVMTQLVEKHTLGEGIGLSWNEISLSQLTAMTIDESTVLDNPQQMVDTLLTVTPTQVGIETLITDLVAKRISKNAYAKTGSLAQNAMERKKDEDGITVLDGFSVELSGTGTTLTSGHIGAGVSQIQGNATEPGHPPFRCVLHPYQIHDIEDEILAGVGTYPLGEGLTARVFTEGFSGMVNQAQIYPDGNIPIDSSTDAKGGVFAQEAIVLIQGYSPRVETRRRPNIGGGATSLYHYDEYAYGERCDHWGAEIYSNATAPTS